MWCDQARELRRPSTVVHIAEHLMWVLDHQRVHATLNADGLAHAPHFLAAVAADADHHTGCALGFAEGQHAVCNCLLPIDLVGQALARDLVGASEREKEQGSSCMLNCGQMMVPSGPSVHLLLHIMSGDA